MSGTPSSTTRSVMAIAKTPSFRKINRSSSPAACINGPSAARGHSLQPAPHRSDRLALWSCVDMHSLSLRTEQTEQLDVLRAGPVEPVRQPGGDLGCLAHLQYQD